MRHYPRRTLAGLTAATLAVLAYQLIAGPPSVYAGPAWSLAFWSAAVGLGAVAAVPHLPAILRAGVAGWSAVVMLTRSAAFAWGAFMPPSDLAGINLGVGALTWLLIAAHTGALLWAWPALEARRD
jgi:hypothetical protein